MSALNLDVLAHSEGHPRSGIVERSTLYRTELGQPGVRDITFRTRVHQDKAYAFQAYANLTVLNPATMEFTPWFSLQDGDHINACAVWEIDNELVQFVARYLRTDASMVQTETEMALYDAGYSRDD